MKGLKIVFHYHHGIKQRLGTYHTDLAWNTAHCYEGTNVNDITVSKTVNNQK
jgi:hypothetical protein